MWVTWCERSAEFRRHVVGKVRRVGRRRVMQDILCLVLGAVLSVSCVFPF